MENILSYVHSAEFHKRGGGGGGEGVVLGIWDFI